MTRELVPIGALFERWEERGRSDLPLLSVYRDLGVVPREGREDNFNRPGEDLDSYKVVRPGDLVLNKMKTWQGSLGVSDHLGIVSPAYFVCRGRREFDRRFLHHLLRSQHLIAEYAARSKGIRPSQWDLPWDEFKSIKVALPSLAEQRAIADHLDAETAHIDALIAKKQQLIDLLEERRTSLALDAIRGSSVTGQRRSSGLGWLGTIPSAWEMPPVYARYDVLLGRMLNAERSSGGDQRPYLRNINVRWLRVELGDVATMDFPEGERRRYLLRPGDLLVCEGGAGYARAAVWDGLVAEMYFQKSLHRVRSRGRWPVRWLAEFLRAGKAAGAFEAGGNLATIPHLTAEQLRAYRIPMPPHPSDAVAIIEQVDRAAAGADQIVTSVRRQLALLSEHRQALITALVTGSMGCPR